MLKLMKKGPWDKSNVISLEESRQYWSGQLRRYRRQELLRRFGLSTLAGLASCAVVWIFMSYGPALNTWSWPSFNSSDTASPAYRFGPFRTCAEARGAGAAPLRRGQPGYASHLDRDNDGVACEWSWLNWFR